MEGVINPRKVPTRHKKDATRGSKLRGFIMAIPFLATNGDLKTIGDLEFGLRSLMNSRALFFSASTHKLLLRKHQRSRLHRLLDAIRSPELLRLWQEVSGSIAPGPGLE